MQPAWLQAEKESTYTVQTAQEDRQMVLEFLEPTGMILY
jgi:hypothetical protein